MPVKSHLCLVIIAALILLVSNAQADLQLTPPQWAPDLSLWSVDVAYNASTKTLMASGPQSGQVFADAEENMYIFDEWGVFNLTATIDNAGVASAGSFSLTGEVLGYGTTGPLLTGNNLSIFNSDFYTTRDPRTDEASLEFLFDVSGGEMADLYGGLGAKVYMLMTFVIVPGGVAETQFTTNFDTLRGNPFGEGTSDTMADIIPMPEPATLSLLAVGAAALLRRRKS
jgi:hypothetical protein